MKNRWEIINFFIEKYKYNKYLEIGTRDCKNFNKIKLKDKIGVDPNPIVENINIIKLTSDDFFNYNELLFDIIFIDGDHNYHQVKKDILNSLDVLNKNGVIICHDMNPPKEENQIVPQKVKNWNGDVWKAWADLRRDISDLNMYVVNTDWGLGVIYKGYQETIDYPKNIKWEWEHLKNDRKNILNLVSVNYFKNKLL